MILDKFMDKLSVREKVFLVCAIVSVFAYATDGIVVEPMRRQIKRMDVDIANQRKSLVFNNGIITQGIPKGYEGMINAIGRFDTPEDAVRQMKDEITELAKKNSIELPSIEDREPVKTAAYDEYVVEVSKFESNMKNVLMFLDALQASQGMLRASRLTLGPGKDPSMVTGSILITKLMIPVSAPSVDKPQ
jgi:hypothetical protein